MKMILLLCKQILMVIKIGFIIFKQNIYIDFEMKFDSVLGKCSEIHMSSTSWLLEVLVSRRCLSAATATDQISDSLQTHESL